MHKQGLSEPPLYRDRNLQIVFAVTLMVVLGVSSITPAFPKIVQELGITREQVGLLITTFTLPGVVLSPLLGIIADRLGRKRVLVPSLFLFGFAGTACAFARDFNLLLLLRVFQGIGSAALGSINITLIGDLYSGRRRAAAMGLNASILSIGTAFYPAIGGALAILGWYYPFALPAIAIPLGVTAITSLRNPEPKNSQGLGAYLKGTWKYLHNGQVAALFSVGILTFIILFGAYLTYFPLLLDDSFRASPLIIGLILSSMSLATAAVSSQLGRITSRVTETTLIKGAFVLYALGLAMIPLVHNLWLFLVPAVILGVAHGANIPSIQTVAARMAPLEYRAAFMSMNSTMLLLGQTLGPVLLGIMYTNRGLEFTFFASATLALTVPAVAVLNSLRK